MSFRRVSPEEALKLVEDEGYAYVDVRSVPEFAAGHPTGAYNVPILEAGAFGMLPNTEFMRVMERTFDKGSKLVVGCQSGGRSMRAASMLVSAGYTDVVDQRAGFGGAPSPSGGWEAGWGPKGLPSSTEAAPERSYEEILGKAK